MRCAVYVRVSTDDQRDNGYSIDSQLRMIKEYCEKNDYDIVDVYNDADHSGKDLMRPEMQRLLNDIKSKKIDKLIAIKVDRLTRNNYDGFWLLNYCEEHDVKIELILEPYDVSTVNGEMIFGMNLVFGQRERKEIGARTKRAMEEMALEKIHPSKAPYGYTRNKKKITIDPDNESKEYTTELMKKLDCAKEDDKLIFTNVKMMDFTFFYNLLSREAKRDMIHRLISQIEITRDNNYNIDIKHIKFTDEFITKSSKEFIKYLNIVLQNDNVVIKYLNEMTKEELETKKKDYDVLSILKMKRDEYPSGFVDDENKEMER